MSGKVVPGAAASGRGDQGTAVPVPFSYEIPHTRKTIPIQGARIYPMSSPFSRTDTRTGLTRDGRVFAAGSGYLWESTDRGRTWTMRKLPVGTGGGFGILDDDVFILIHDAPDHSVTYVQRSTDYGESWSEPFPLDVSPYTFSGSGWSDVYQHPDGTAMITVTLRHRDGVDEWDNPRGAGFPRPHLPVPGRGPELGRPDPDPSLFGREHLDGGQGLEPDVGLHPSPETDAPGGPTRLPGEDRSQPPPSSGY